MDPAWLPNKPDKLATDRDLRAVQLRWLWDTLYMRRITFALSILSVPINVTLLIVDPRAAAVTIPASALGLGASLTRTMHRAHRES